MSDGAQVTAWLTLFGLLFVAIFWGAWRAYMPAGFLMYLGMWVCMVVAVVSAVNSTLPSSAPRVRVTGIITGIIEHKHGRSTDYTVTFRTSAGRQLVLDAAATPLFFAKNRDVVALTYLDEESISHAPRAIRFEALTGPRAGEITHVSADWFGPWLGVLFASIFGIAAIYGANSHKRGRLRTDPAF